MAILKKLWETLDYIQSPRFCWEGSKNFLLEFLVLKRELFSRPIPKLPMIGVFFHVKGDKSRLAVRAKLEPKSSLVAYFSSSLTNTNEN